MKPAIVGALQCFRQYILNALIHDSLLVLRFQLLDGNLLEPMVFYEFLHQRHRFVSLSAVQVSEKEPIVLVLAKDRSTNPLFSSFVTTFDTAPLVIDSPRVSDACVLFDWP